MHPSLLETITTYYTKLLEKPLTEAEQTRLIAYLEGASIKRVSKLPQADPEQVDYRELCDLLEGDHDKKDADAIRKFLVLLYQKSGYDAHQARKEHPANDNSTLSRLLQQDEDRYDQEFHKKDQFFIFNGFMDTLKNAPGDMLAILVDKLGGRELEEVPHNSDGYPGWRPAEIEDIYKLLVLCKDLERDVSPAYQLFAEAFDRNVELMMEIGVREFELQGGVSAPSPNPYCEAALGYILRGETDALSLFDDIPAGKVAFFPPSSLARATERFACFIQSGEAGEKLRRLAHFLVIARLGNACGDFAHSMLETAPGLVDTAYFLEGNPAPSVAATLAFYDGVAGHLLWMIGLHQSLDGDNPSQRQLELIAAREALQEQTKAFVALHPQQAALYLDNFTPQFQRTGLVEVYAELPHLDPAPLRRAEKAMEEVHAKEMEKRARRAAKAKAAPKKKKPVHKPTPPGQGSKRRRDMQKCFPPGMEFPEELGLFCDWVEESGFEFHDFELWGRESNMVPYFDTEEVAGDFGCFGSYNGDDNALWKGSVAYFAHEGVRARLTARNIVEFLYNLADNIKDQLEETDMDEDEIEEIDEEYLEEDLYGYNFYRREGNEAQRFFDWLEATFPDPDLYTHGDGTRKEFKEYLTQHIDMSDWSKEDKKAFFGN